IRHSSVGCICGTDCASTSSSMAQESARPTTPPTLGSGGTGDRKWHRSRVLEPIDQAHDRMKSRNGSISTHTMVDDLPAGWYTARGLGVLITLMTVKEACVGLIVGVVELGKSAGLGRRGRSAPSAAGHRLPRTVSPIGRLRSARSVHHAWLSW